MPMNAVTGRAYSGINIPLLWHAADVHAYPTHRWLTYKQALAVGGQVRKGQKSTTVVAFSEMFVSHLLARTIRVEADLVDQLFNSSEKRLARALLLLANFGKEGRPEQIVAKISQETLAEMIGTTRARVSFFMNKFRKLGLIDYNGLLEIHSSLLNVVLHDEPHINN
jgi:hypothetical protein